MSSLVSIQYCTGPLLPFDIKRLPACAVINRSRGTECQHLDLYLRLPPVSNFVP